MTPPHSCLGLSEQLLCPASWGRSTFSGTARGKMTPCLQLHLFFIALPSVSREGPLVLWTVDCGQDTVVHAYLWIEGWKRRGQKELIPPDVHMAVRTSDCFLNKGNPHLQGL